MRRGFGGIARWLGWAVCLFGMTLGVAADVVAQSSPKIYRIGWLGNGYPPSKKPNVTDHGFLESWT
jgi:hypothetical protein